MSARQPRVTAVRLIRALKRAGWQEVRARGGHAQLVHPDKPGRVTIPRHAGETLSEFVVASVLRQAGLTTEDLKDLL